MEMDFPLLRNLHMCHQPSYVFIFATAILSDKLLLKETKHKLYAKARARTQTHIHTRARAFTKKYKHILAHVPMIHLHDQV